MQLPNKSDSTGIAGCLLGFGVAVATVMIPWDAPLWLKHVAFWISAGIAVLSVQWLIHLHLLEGKSHARKKATHALILAALLALIIFVELPRLSRATQRQDAASGNNYDLEVSVECSIAPLPTRRRPDRETHIFQIGSGAYAASDGSTNNFLADTMMLPGTDDVKNNNVTTFDAGMCIVRNFGSRPIFRVDLPFNIVKIGSVAVNGGRKSTGKIVMSKRLIMTAHFGSPEQQDVFYFWNQSEQFIWMCAEERAVVFFAGSEAPETVRITRPLDYSGASLYLMPAMRFTNPQAAPPPTPTPPPQPEKK